MPYAIDEENDLLTYTFKAGNNGVEGPFNLTIADVVYEEDAIYVSFTGIGREMKNFVVQVTVSDGKLEAKQTSEVFSFASENLPDNNNPDNNNPDNDNQGDSNGGGFSCNMGAYMIYALLPLGLLPLFRKRK